MYGTALNRTWNQLLHPTFRSVFLTSLFAALLTLALLSYSAWTYWPESLRSGIGFLDKLGQGIAIAASWYLLFPALVTTVISLFTDKIAGAVEEDYYPHRRAEGKIHLADILISSGKLALLIVVLNIAALILYIPLFFLTGGIGTLALYLLLNGYLLGREYFDMVAIRHMPHKNMTSLRRTYKQPALICGIITAGMFLVPGLNLLAPIVGAAVMTHIFHLYGIKRGITVPNRARTPR